MEAQTHWLEMHQAGAQTLGVFAANDEQARCVEASRAQPCDSGALQLSGGKLFARPDAMISRSPAWTRIWKRSVIAARNAGQIVERPGAPSRLRIQAGVLVTRKSSDLLA